MASSKKKDELEERPALIEGAGDLEEIASTFSKSSTEDLVIPSAAAGTVVVTSVHGALDHDGLTYQPGEPIVMNTLDAERLGARVKPAK